MTTAEKLVRLTQTLPEPILAEVLDIEKFLSRSHLADERSPDRYRPLSDLIGLLEHSPAFQGNLVKIQKRM